MTNRTETLVCIDWNGGTDLTPVLDRVGAALVDVESTLIDTTSNGHPVTKTAHRVRFDTSVLRNTDAHGIGYRAGFVCHIEATS